MMTTRLAGFFPFLPLVMTVLLPCLIARADTHDPHWVYVGPVLTAGLEDRPSYEFVDIANVRHPRGDPHYVTYWERLYSGTQLDPLADADPRERAWTARFHAAIASGRPLPRIDLALTARILEDALDDAGPPELQTYGLIDCRSDTARTLETLTFFNGSTSESHYSESDSPWRGIPPGSTLAALEHLVCKPGIAQ